jgi:hypothetical protein
MSHPTHRSWGALLRAQFDCSQEPLPSKLEVLLCFLDGAERRRQLQTKLKTFDPPHRMKFDRPVDVHWVPADRVPEAGPDWHGNQRHFDSLRQAAQFVMHGLSIADRANVWITTEDGNLTIEQIEQFA